MMTEKNTTTTKTETRGRPIDLDVQEQRLEEEARTIRALTGRIDAANLRFESHIVASLKVVARLARHLENALRVKQTISENL